MFLLCLMEKIIAPPTPQELLDARMKDGFQKLNKIAIKKTQGKNTNYIFTYIGFQLGITGQTVSNYVHCKLKTGNGYLIEALIAEFKKYKPNGLK